MGERSGCRRNGEAHASGTFRQWGGGSTPHEDAVLANLICCAASTVGTAVLVSAGHFLGADDIIIGLDDPRYVILLPFWMRRKYEIGG
jgi:hypothetical protein